MTTVGVQAVATAGPAVVCHPMAPRRAALQAGVLARVRAGYARPVVEVVVVGVDLAGIAEIWTALPGWTKKPSALVLWERVEKNEVRSMFLESLENPNNSKRNTTSYKLGT